VDIPGLSSKADAPAALHPSKSQSGPRLIPLGDNTSATQNDGGKAMNWLRSGNPIAIPAPHPEMHHKHSVKDHHKHRQFQPKEGHDQHQQDHQQQQDTATPRGRADLELQGPRIGDVDIKAGTNVCANTNENEDEPESKVVFVWDDGDGLKHIEEYSEDHAKLLYLVSLYARCALTPDDREGWMRMIPMMVLMYEGITKGSLDFDYAPSSCLISHDGVSKRKWMNVTQEGRSAVDDLREAHLMQGLKLTTEDFQPVTAYQVTTKGLSLIEQMSRELKAEVDSFAYPPQVWIVQNNARRKAAGTMTGSKTKPLSVVFDGEVFSLHGVGEAEGYSHTSSVMDTEDVSYVSSPYLPTCVRQVGEVAPLSSNAHRAHESAEGVSAIADELSEAIHLDNVFAIVGEWIPFGPNQVVALNQRLGALDRCQGGLFTAQVDLLPSETQFCVPPGLTQVAILDYDYVKFINFEAEINYPEDEGIVQVESFGIHLHMDGLIFYGLKIEVPL
jgi:hypothetical protein